MARLVLSPEAIHDLERLSTFLVDTDPAGALATTALVVEGLEISTRHPLVGRPAGESRRELIISRGRTGYVALYEYDEAYDRVVIHGVRHQREIALDEGSAED